MRIVCSLLVFLLTLAAFGQWSGLAAYETYRGYLAPIWSADGRFVYFMERESAGFVLGFGYDYFTPLADVYLFQDDLILSRLDLIEHTTQALTRIQLEPKTRRWLTFNRGSIFGNVQGGIFEEDGLIKYEVRFEHGRIPVSTFYTDGVWPANNEGGETHAWRRFPTPFIFSNDQVLQAGRELLLAKGPENFGSAILAVDENGQVDPLVTSSSYLHREGLLPPVMNATRRQHIEAVREKEAFEKNLLAEIRSAGRSEGAVQQLYTLELERQGRREPTRRLVAEEVNTIEPDDKVFPLRENRFLPHTYPDLRLAISNPGLLVEAEIHARVRYGARGELPGPKDWLEAGNRTFVIDTDQGLFRIKILDPEQWLQLDT